MSTEPVLKTDFIACEHFKGRHTHDKVAEKLSAIFDRFGIKEKVDFVTTDGAGEYTAAFKFYGDNYESINLCDADDDYTTEIPSSSAAVRDRDGDSCEIASTSTSTVTGVNTGVSPPVSASGQVQLQKRKHNSSQMDTDDEDAAAADSFMDIIYRNLPKNPNEIDNDSFVLQDSAEVFTMAIKRRLLGKMNRVDCSAHKIDKLASIDAETALNDSPDYATIHSSVFDKLNRIWAQKKSRLNAEIFKQITGKAIIGPHRIRWLKMFEAVS